MNQPKEDHLNPTAADVGKRIRHRLVDLEMCQSDLSKQLGYGRANPQTFNAWVRDKKSLPSPIILPVLCRQLACSIDWLLTGAEGSAI